MKKILFVMPNLAGGGAEKVLLDVLKKINREKFEITLLLFEKKGIYIEQIPKDIKVETIREKFGKIPGRIWLWYLKKNPQNFYKKVIKEKYDVEVAFMEGYSTKLIANSNNNESKKITWVHIDMLVKHWTKNMYYENEEKECYKKFNDIVFVSNDSAKSFDKLFNMKFENKKVIYNPIIGEEIIEKSLTKEVNYDKFTIISSGRLDKQKGFDRLIKVHIKLVKEFEHKLIILGEGIEREYLEKLIKEGQVEESVELMGFMKNPHPYIKAADVFVCSSRTEGFSLVVAEAVVLEKAIIATDITGPREVLSEGEYGIICENSEDGLYESIKSVLNNRKIIEKYEEKSKFGKEKFAYKKIIEEIENLF